MGVGSLTVKRHVPRETGGSALIHSCSSLKLKKIRKKNHVPRDEPLGIRKKLLLDGHVCAKIHMFSEFNMTSYPEVLKM